MRTSELFRKKLLDTYVGGITNKFRIEKRRDCVFFADIFINYIRECENSGYSEEMREAGREWMFLYFDILVPSAIKKLPFPILSRIMKRVWINLGLMEDFSMKNSKGAITIRTRNEVITRIMGKNNFSVGLFEGICNSLLGSGMDIVEVNQGRGENLYVFRPNPSKSFVSQSKGKKLYDRLNFSSRDHGFSLSEAFKSKVFTLRENMMYFRGKPLYTIENTLFHLIGNMNINLGKIPEISYKVFREIVDEDSPDFRKLSLLKMAFQTMGWGVFKIIVDGKTMRFDIKNPPFGLQRADDNWFFLEGSILGYLWIIDRNFQKKETRSDGKRLQMTFSKNHRAHQ